MRNRIILIVLIVLVLGAGAFVMLRDKKQAEEVVVEEVLEVAPVVPELAPIGQSVEGRIIEAISFGEGETDLLFVGGIHGGYEWNSIVLAYEMIDHFTENEAAVPEGITVHIVPNLNPDGLFAVTGLTGRFAASDVTATVEETIPGRFNVNGVDLNRNFDCKWQPTSSWRGNEISAGTEAFSEPEAKAIRDYIAKTSPRAAIFWHSQANNVYASECENGVLPETLDIMNAYADAAGYGAVASFDAYPVTGDVEGWLASIGIPAITVELKTHETVEFEQNLRGVEALLNYYTQ